MRHFGLIDWGIVIFYFTAMACIGPLFARRNRSTESFFVGNRSFPAWLLGLAMFATSISSITVVAYPADAFRTGYLRLLPALTLPIGIYLASRICLPFYRRAKVTSAFEYLETRFGPGVRLYAAIAFLFSQLTRISTILYLVSLVFEQMTGASPHICIVAGGIVLGIYTVAGGIRAIVWAQFIQAFLLWFGALLCFVMLVRGIDGGIGTIVSTALANDKFTLGDLVTPAALVGQVTAGAATVAGAICGDVGVLAGTLLTDKGFMLPSLASAFGHIAPAPWVSLQEKAVILMLFVGLSNWLMEYSSNQNVIQKYVAAKNPKEATRSIWICCFCSIPTWAFFMFLGTGLYVYYQQHADLGAHIILSGANGAKAESILPYFCVQVMPTGVAGLVITGVLAAAMSASSSSINSISAVGITDVYRRHLVKNKSDRHYVTAARIVSAASCLLMMGGAVLFLKMTKLTLQDTGTKMGAIIAGGLVGLYALGFLTRRGDGRSVAAGICCTVAFSAYITALETGIITKAGLISTFGMSESLAQFLSKPVHTYYTGIFGNIVMFVIGYTAACLIPRRPRDLTNLTVWTPGPVTQEE